jgi:TolB-like protein
LPRKGFRFVAEVREEGSDIGNPAIAVMPFQLLSNERASAYLARGLADQLAATLGQASWLDVRDTSSSFSPKLESKPPREMAAALNANYLVQGSVQTQGEKLKLSVRLTEPIADRQIWSQSFFGSKDEIFELQDDLVVKLLGEIEPRLRHSELQKSASRHGNFSAFDHYLRANDLLRPMDMPAMIAACDELDSAVHENPQYASALAMRAWIATLLVPHGRRVDEAAEIARCRKALSHGAFDCDALSMAGYSLGFFERNPQSGIGYLRRALAINPSSARGHDHLGWLLLYSGQANEALIHFDKGLALSPIDEFAFRMLTGRAFALLFLADYDSASNDAIRAHSVAPLFSVCLRVLTAALAHQGNKSGAAQALAELHHVNPSLTLKRYERETRFEGSSDRKILFSGLSSAGLK